MKLANLKTREVINEWTSEHEMSDNERALLRDKCKKWNMLQ